MGARLPLNPKLTHYLALGFLYGAARLAQEAVGRKGVRSKEGLPSMTNSFINRAVIGARRMPFLK
jgi:hypothetical protein